jgi:predicted nicotinamide N-methyase
MGKFRVCYNTYEFESVDIHLRTLRDRQEFYDQGGVAETLGISSASWPMFGVVWPSSLVLAHHLVGLDFAEKRILEVGCGIGLVSVLLNHLDADVTATDHHPEGESFLDQNTRLNQDPKIPFVRTAWADAPSDLGEFDLLVGSDLLYEDSHVAELASFLSQHGKPACEVVLVDPGRGRQGRFNRQMAARGFSQKEAFPENVDYLDQPYKGKILSYNRGVAAA